MPMVVAAAGEALKYHLLALLPPPALRRTRARRACLSDTGSASAFFCPIAGARVSVPPAVRRRAGRAIGPPRRPPR
eukprot:796569-Prymnesium_polylepis.1